MDEDPYFEKIKKVLIDEQDVDVNKINPDARFIDDLDLDSLDVVSVVMGIEEAFGMPIHDDDVEKMVTVRDAVRFVSSRLEAPATAPSPSQAPRHRRPRAATQARRSVHPDLPDSLVEAFAQESMEGFVETLCNLILSRTRFDFSAVVLRITEGRRKRFVYRIKQREPFFPEDRVKFNLSIGPLEASLFLRKDPPPFLKFEKLEPKKSQFHPDILGFVSKIVVVPMVDNGAPLGTVYAGYVPNDVRRKHKTGNQARINERDLRYLCDLRDFSQKVLHNMMIISNISTINRVTREMARCERIDELFSHLNLTLNEQIPGTASAVLFPRDRNWDYYDWSTKSKIMSYVLEDGSLVKFLGDGLHRVIANWRSPDPGERTTIISTERRRRHMDFPSIPHKKKTPQLLAAKLVPFDYGGEWPGVVVILGNYLRIYEREDNEVISPIVGYFSIALNSLISASQRTQIIARDLESAFQLVVHRINHPIDILEASLTDYVETKIPKYSNECFEKIEELRHLSAKFQDVAKEVSLDMQPVFLCESMESWIRECTRSGDPRVTMHFEVDRDLKIVTDETVLGIAMKAILGNAESYAKKTDKIVIELSLVKGDTTSSREVLVKVMNTGTSIPDHVVKKAFDLGFSTREGRLHSGLGLYLAKKYISVLGGRVWLESSDNEVSCFVRLPMAGGLLARHEDISD